MSRIIRELYNLITSSRTRRKMLTAMSCLVVFVMTYLLILPAFTLETMTAEQMGGIDVPSASISDSQEDDAASPDADNTDLSKVSEVSRDLDAASDTGADTVEEHTDSSPAPADQSTDKDSDIDESSTYSQVYADPLVYEGDGYVITVEDKSGALDSNSELEVEEILPGDGNDASMPFDYDEYVSKTEDALGMEEGSAGYIRLFDIKIVDKDDHSVKYQPAEGSAVDVRIELADAESDELNVVHFADDNEEGDVVENTTENAEEGAAVEFQAEGFSVYSVVDVSEPEVQEEVTVTSLADLVGHGFYIDNTLNDSPPYIVKCFSLKNQCFFKSLTSRMSLIHGHLSVSGTRIECFRYTKQNVLHFPIYLAIVYPSPLWQRTSRIYQDHLPIGWVLTSFVPPAHKQGASSARLQGHALWRIFLPATGSFFI